MKKHIYFLAAVFSAVFFSVSCEENTGVDPVPGQEPVFTSTIEEGSMEVTADGGEYTITYNIENPAEDGTVRASAGQKDWIGGLNCETPGIITFTVSPNESEEERQGTITAIYEYSSGDPQTFETVILQAGVSKQEPIEDPFTIEVPEEEITSSSARVISSCIDPNLWWCTQIMRKVDFEEKVGDKSNMGNYLLETLNNDAALNGYESISDYLPSFLNFGAYTDDYEYSKLTSETEFMTYSVGMDLDGNFTTDFYWGPEFKTKEIEIGGLTFDIEVSAGSTSAVLNVYPSDQSVYFLATAIETTLDKTDEEIMQEIVDEYGYVLGLLAYMGNTLGIEVNDLAPATEYYAIAFGVEIWDYTFNSAMTKVEFTTK